MGMEHAVVYWIVYLAIFMVPMNSCICLYEYAFYHLSFRTSTLLLCCFDCGFRKGVVRRRI